MDGDEQRMIVVCQPDEAAADQRPARQVERRRGLVQCQAPQLVLHVRALAQVMILQDDALPLRRRDPLHRLPIDRREARPQHLVPRDDAVERTRQRVPVQRATQPQTDREMVGRAGPAQLLEEPEPLLRERKRDRRGPIHRRDRRLGPCSGG
jgi:hypothetical protein